MLFGKKKKHVEKVEQILTGLLQGDKDSGWIGVFIFPPPNKKVIKSLGLAYVSKTMESAKEKGAKEVIDDVIMALVNKAKERGGNALIGFRLEIGTYQYTGSSWTKMHPVAYGEVVILKEL